MQWSGWKEHYQFFWSLPHVILASCLWSPWSESYQTFYRRNLKFLRKSGLSSKRPEIRTLFWEVSLIWSVLWQIFQALAVELSCPGNMRNKERGWQFVLTRTRRTVTLLSHLEVLNHPRLLNQISEQRICKNQPAVHMALGGTAQPYSSFLLSRSDGHLHNNKGHSCGDPDLYIWWGSTLVTLVSTKALSIKDGATFQTVTDHGQVLWKVIGYTFKWWIRDVGVSEHLLKCI